jgi:hypothetical protein
MVVSAQSNARRLTTVAAIRQFPGYYHLQNVMLRGELIENGSRTMLRSDDQEIRAYLKDGTGRSGAVEVRGQVLDIGRLQPDDPRVPAGDTRDPNNWPKPGEELVVNVTSVAEAQPAVTASVRALALEPWKFDGQTVTVTGNFRGRNLFGDVPDAPGKSRYDFVLRGAEGAVWVTGMRPRGKGFDLDVDRRQDTTSWLQVTGTVTRNRGLAIIAATQLSAAAAPDATEPPAEDAAAPPPPSPPAEVVFSSPTPDESDVSPSAPIRIQFSRGLLETSIAGHVRVSYVGAPDADPGLTFKATYDGATRALELRFAQPLVPFRTVKVETLDGLKAFDGAPVKPWTLTFSLGG